MKLTMGQDDAQHNSIRNGIFIPAAGGIHNKSALDAAACGSPCSHSRSCSRCCCERIPLGSRPTNGARTAVVAGGGAGSHAGQHAGSRAAGWDGLPGLPSGNTSDGDGDTMLTNTQAHNEATTKRVLVTITKGRGTVAAHPSLLSSLLSARLFPREIAAQTGLKLLQCCRAIPAPARVCVCVSL